uniref:RRM domain-containing protein n=1 Tax=Salix viminalis TaxID=40686 RepID=A0A6N2NJK7_SALVM
MLQMDGEILFGRELTVVFAEENRKKPAEMRARDRVSGGRYSDRRRSPSPSYGRNLFLLEIEGIETKPTQGPRMVQGAIAGAQLGIVAEPRVV